MNEPLYQASVPGDNREMNSDGRTPSEQQEFIRVAQRQFDSGRIAASLADEIEERLGKDPNNEDLLYLSAQAKQGKKARN